MVGEDALELYNMFTWDEDKDQNKMKRIMKKFKAYVIPKRTQPRKDVFSTPEHKKQTKQ